MTDILKDSFAAANFARDLGKVKEATSGCYDLVIIGGGIHGAWLARDAILRGCRVLLLEARDYGEGTSSRSSKMIHGGVRYLESGDVKLVFESLAERARLLDIASHLSREQRFFYPAISGSTRPGWQNRIGLTAYDALAKISSLRDGTKALPGCRGVSQSEAGYKRLENMGLSFDSLLEYSDGQMNDVRIVVEAILDASELGATCLNHAPVKAISRKGKNFQVEWERAGESYSTETEFIINCTGPWSSGIEKMLGREQDTFPKLVLSRGTHLLFDVPWEGPGLILPTGEKGRYYFVWPHFHPGSNATLVGTTDQITKEVPDDPQANQVEIDQLVGYIKRDLPSSDLAGAEFYQSFCGLRALAQTNSGSGSVSSISRSEIWLEGEGWLSLAGGKYTSARHTAESGISKYFEKQKKAAVSKDIIEQVRSRKLPGSQGQADQAKLKKQLDKTLSGASEERKNAILDSLIARFGSKSEEVIAYSSSENADSVSNGLLFCEVKYTIEREQPITVIDILRRRLGLSHLAGFSSKAEELVREIAGR